MPPAQVSLAVVGSPGMEAEAAQGTGTCRGWLKSDLEVHVLGRERVVVGGVPSWENCVPLGCCVVPGKSLPSLSLRALLVKWGSSQSVLRVVVR